MSSINIDINNENASSEESSLGVNIRVIPGNQETESPSSDSNSESSVDSNERQRTCIIEIQVETPLPGRRSRSINQAKGVTVRILQSNLHRVWIYTPEDVEQKKNSVNPNEDAIQVWSPLNCMPWKFEIEVQERKAVNPLKRPASRPGWPQQEAGGPREASRRLNR